MFVSMRCDRNYPLDWVRRGSLTGRVGGDPCIGMPTPWAALSSRSVVGVVPYVTVTHG